GPNGALPTQYYFKKNKNAKASGPLADEYSSNDPTSNISQLLVCGTGLYVMSALEVGQFVASISLGGPLISYKEWQNVLAAPAPDGLQGGAVFSDSAGAYGTYFWKNGLWGGLLPTKAGKGPTGPGYQTAWVRFPGGATAVLFVNTRSPKEISLEGVL